MFHRDGQFSVAGRSAESLAVGENNDVGGVALGNALRSDAGVFENERVIEKIESLWGDDAGVALAGDDAGVSKIEQFEDLWKGVAERGDINAAAH